MLQVKSSASWTNEEFGKIYEPVSATELRRQHQVAQILKILGFRFVLYLGLNTNLQVKELKKQLQNLSPEWDRTVESISTMRRKKVKLFDCFVSLLNFAALQNCAHLRPIQSTQLINQP